MFTVTKNNEKRVKQVERERKLTQRILKRQITWVSKNGYDGSFADICSGSISQVPLALIDSEGLPYKSSKSTTTKYLENRYKQAAIIKQGIPPQCVSEVAIWKACFNTNPTNCNHELYG